MKNDTIQDRAIFMETECHVWQDDNIEWSSSTRDDAKENK